MLFVKTKLNFKKALHQQKILPYLILSKSFDNKCLIKIKNLNYHINRNSFNYKKLLNVTTYTILKRLGLITFNFGQNKITNNIISRSYKKTNYLHLL